MVYRPILGDDGKDAQPATIVPIIDRRKPTPVASFTPHGSLAVIRTLFERARDRHDPAFSEFDPLTEQEALMGLDHVAKLEKLLDDQHTEQHREGCARD